VKSGFEKLMSETDFRKQAQEYPLVKEAMAHGLDPLENLAFVAYFVDGPEWFEIKDNSDSPRKSHRSGEITGNAVFAVAHPRPLEFDRVQGWYFPIMQSVSGTLGLLALLGTALPAIAQQSGREAPPASVVPVQATRIVIASNNFK
jgi:hypothetical protein